MKKKVERVYGKNSNHRLTVTPDRITMKFKSSASEEECAQVEQFLLKVAEELKDTECSLRGILTDEGNLLMLANSKECIKTFQYGEDKTTNENNT